MELTRVWHAIEQVMKRHFKIFPCNYCDFGDFEVLFSFLLLQMLQLCESYV